MKNIISNLIIISSLIALAKADRGKCDLPLPTLDRICHLCQTLAKHETQIQNRSIRTKIACVGLVNHNCCVGLYIFNADISRIFQKRDFQSISRIGFMWSFFSGILIGYTQHPYRRKSRKIAPSGRLTNIMVEPCTWCTPKFLERSSWRPCNVKRL